MPVGTPERIGGDLEQAIMDCLWQKGGTKPRSASWVRSQIVYPHPLAYSTVSTVMGNLTHKGLLSRRKVEPDDDVKDDERRAWLYSATVTRDGYAVVLMMYGLAKAEDRVAAIRIFLEQAGSDGKRAMRPV